MEVTGEIRQDRKLNNCSYTKDTEMTFKERLEELMHSLPVNDPHDKMEIQSYSKWRIQVTYLLVHYLGETHPYTKELSTTLTTDMDPYSLGNYVLMGKGILEGLTEDIDSGLIQIRD